MGLFKVLGCVAGGAVAIVAAPTVIASAAVSTVGMAAITGATMLGASVSTAATVGTVASMGAVGAAGGYATKKAFDYAEEKQEEHDNQTYSRGFQAGKSGEQSKCDVLKKENEIKDKQIKRFNELIELYKKRIQDQENLIKEQDKLLYICFEKYPDVISEIISKFNLNTEKAKAIDFYISNTNSTISDGYKVINKLIEYVS